LDELTIDISCAAFLVPFKPPAMPPSFSPSVTAVAQARARDSPVNANPRKIRKVSKDLNEQEEIDTFKRPLSTAFGAGDENRRLEPEQQKIEDTPQKSESGQVDGANKQTRGEEDYSRFKGRGRYHKSKQLCVFHTHRVILH
jgi:hypothetical protein